MGTVTAGQSLTVNIPADTAWTVTTTGEATVFLVSGAAGAGYTSWRVTPTQPNVIAPFSAAGIIRIVGVSGVTTDGAKPPEGVSRARAEQLDALVSGDRIADATSRSITSEDNAKFLAPTGSLTYTIPAGLDPMPSFTVDCPVSGTVSIARSGGATLNGAGTTLTRTRASNPVGFVVLAHESDAYGVSGA